MEIGQDYTDSQERQTTTTKLTTSGVFESDGTNGASQSSRDKWSNEPVRHTLGKRTWDNSRNSNIKQRLKKRN